MATMSFPAGARSDWLLANPWVWLATGLGFTAWAVAWTFAFSPEAADLRVVVLALGLLCAGIGVWIRHADRQTSYLRDRFPGVAGPFRFLMGVIFALAAFGATCLLILSFLQRPDLPIPVGPACLIFLTVAPLASSAAWRTLRRLPGQNMMEIDEEVGLAWWSMAGLCVLGSLTLSPQYPNEWDSMRLLLRVGAVLCSYAAALIVAPIHLRRLVLSFVFVVHFMGISSAALAAPPAPWIVMQAWLRVFRPYLEFMYLNNAYHFYAPDPGPSSYIWFRIIYTDGVNDFGKWYKLPHVDENGKVLHSVALEYQRYLAMTEQIGQKDALPSDMYFNAEKQEWQPHPMYMNRLRVSDPDAPLQVGIPVLKHPRIPFHPNIPQNMQVNIPADGPRRLIASFARHIANRFPIHVDDKGKTFDFKSVKVYRVIHQIPPVSWYQYKMAANDPVTYQPFYVGNYNADGVLLKDGDPYLYWMLPILRERPNDPDSRIRDYCRLHAGDPHWQMNAKDWKNND